jgi:hypothetical protein
MKPSQNQQPAWKKKQPDSYVLGTFEYSEKSLPQILQQIEAIPGVTGVRFNSITDIEIKTVPGIQVLDITLETETNTYQIIATKN